MPHHWDCVPKEKDQTILEWYVTIIYECEINPLKQQRQRKIVIEEYVYRHSWFAEKCTENITASISEEKKIPVFIHITEFF